MLISRAHVFFPACFSSFQYKREYKEEINGDDCARMKAIANPRDGAAKLYPTVPIDHANAPQIAGQRCFHVSFHQSRKDDLGPRKGNRMSKLDSMSKFQSY